MWTICSRSRISASCVCGPKTLSSLEFGACKTHLPWIWHSKTSLQALQDCVERSRATLTSLTLSYVKIKSADLKELLGTLPFLEHLCVADEGGDRSLINLAVNTLTPAARSGRGDMCIPRLRDLELRMRWNPNCEKLTRLLRVRSVANSGALFSLTLRLHEEGWVADWARRDLLDLLPSLVVKVGMPK